MTSLFSKERIYAEPGFNRWKMPPASIAIHLCIGSAYAWSIYNPALTRVLGVATSAADDWSLDSVVRTFTIAMVVLGFAAAFAGKWLEQVGPRVVGAVAAVYWGGGFLIGAAGILTHQLWMVYLGYGVIGGCGLGLGYVSPVSTLIKWFPDRRGMAAGMAIMGFGGGAMIGAPLEEFLIKHFYQAPDYVGSVEQVTLKTENGRRLAELAGQWREVVEVGANDVRQMIVPGPEGVYLVGTGRTGVAETFCTLGVLYTLIMLGAAFSFRLPRPDWRPAGWAPPDPEAAARSLVSLRNVDASQALHTPQFYLLWLLLCFNVTAGIGVLSVAKTMITEIFGTTLPQIVTGSFATTYVLMISVFNMAGRIFWASTSDHIGRKTTYTLFFVFGIALYLTIPFTAYRVSLDPDFIWLALFCTATMLAITMYGGGFATIPAYIADLFGARFVGAIHGRILTAWSMAGVVGPLAITTLRERSLRQAVKSLVSLIDPAVFAERFGAPVADLDALLAKKTVTISKLMELAPPGTINPSATLYNSTMYLMAGLLALALVANLLVKPVDEKHHLPAEA